MSRFVGSVYAAFGLQTDGFKRGSQEVKAGLRDLDQAADQAGQGGTRIGGVWGNTMGTLRGAASGATSFIQSAFSVAVGNIISQISGNLLNAITGTFGRLISLNADMQSSMASFTALLSDTAVGIGETSSQAASSMASVGGAASSTLANVGQQMADLSADYEQRVADLQAAMGQVAAQAGGAMGQGIAGGMRVAVNEIAAMFEEGGFFYGLESAEERAQKLMDWVKERARRLPGSVDDYVAAAQRLLTYRLDPTRWMETAASAAAAFQVPVKQVVDALGTLATGDAGEALMRFREFGIDLRSMEGLELDARGALVTPIDEALDVIQANMDRRFEPMLETAGGTWHQVMGNLGDVWDEFLRVVGGPLFEKLNEGLVGLLEYLDENEEQVQALAEMIGEGLVEAFEWLLGAAEDAGPVVFEIFEFLVDAAGEIIPIVEDVIEFVGGLFQSFSDGQGTARTVMDTVGGLIRNVQGALIGAWAVLRPILDRRTCPPPLPNSGKRSSPS